MLVLGGEYCFRCSARTLTPPAARDGYVFMIVLFLTNGSTTLSQRMLHRHLYKDLTPLTVVLQ